MVVGETVVPGVIGNPESLVEESHSDGLLEYPVYTKPAVWRERAVPEILLSGHHGRIERWRRDQQLSRTAQRRPDMILALDPAQLDRADLAVLADHERELFGAEAWSLASWWGELAGRPRREYVVAEDADGIAGYGGLDHAGDTSDVMTIATLPRARGTGLGRRLLAELVDRARSAAAERLVLEVRADNVAARGLYDSAGFGLLQTRRGYYPGGVDALVLALDLTQETQA